MRTAAFFTYVWPEPRSSAAGVRTLELMQYLLESGWRVLAFSPSQESPYKLSLEKLGVKAFTVSPNESTCEESLRATPIDLMLFDRFVMEEQFGWRMRELWPHALSIVDTQDLHSVRRFREGAIKNGTHWEELPPPDVAQMDEDLLRELSSFYRVDGTIVVSNWEEKWLVEAASFPRENLLWLPLEGNPEASFPSFQERNGFCFLGNFRHPPNLDGVLWFIETLWPRVRKTLPHAELHLYGAYPPARISSLHKKNGISCHGPIENHRAALKKHRVLVAPLRFGAGIKGKVLESWSTGAVVVGTPMAFEGLGENSDSCGWLARTESDFVSFCSEAHENESKWKAVQTQAHLQLHRHFSREVLKARFLQFLNEKIADYKEKRRSNLLGRMLRHNQHNSMKYFSRWIEEKNKRTQTP